MALLCWEGRNSTGDCRIYQVADIMPTLYGKGSGS
jgi:hypothetical protein